MTAEKIRLPEHPDLLLGDAQLLPGLPQGADLRRFTGLLHAAGEAHLSRLAAEGGGPDLEEKMQPVGLLHKRAQNRVAVAGFQHLGDIAVKPALQIVQFPAG